MNQKIKIPNYTKTITTIKYLLVLLAALTSVACANIGSTAVGNDSTVTEAAAKQLPGDVTLPPGAVIKQQDTLVMSAANTWMGRISFSVSGEPQTVFAYFRNSLPTTGCTLTSNSFSKTSLLTFTKAERVATAQMQGTNFDGNDVLNTVAPAVRAGAARP